jgi:2-polyprenyl-3-methyl-5-hydroxy-6-metoxy-1,4-benzoquinol methylase
MPSFRTEKDQFILDFCRGKRVLDVGCVNHNLEATHKDDWRHAQIAKVAKKLVGLDYEAAVVADLQKRGWDVVAADAQDFDIAKQYPDGFEAVVASEIIEHLVNPGAFLVCLRKHLAPGGRILITTPHAFGMAFFLEVLVWNEEHMNDDHTMIFSKKNLALLIRKCGLEVKEFHWLIQDSTTMHSGGATRIIAKIFFYVQYVFALIRSGFSKEMIFIAGRPGE